MNKLLLISILIVILASPCMAENFTTSSFVVDHAEWGKAFNQTSTTSYAGIKFGAWEQAGKGETIRYQFLAIPFKVAKNLSRIVELMMIAMTDTFGILNSIFLILMMGFGFYFLYVSRNVNNGALSMFLIGLSFMCFIFDMLAIQSVTTDYAIANSIEDMNFMLFRVLTWCFYGIAAYIFSSLAIKSYTQMAERKKYAGYNQWGVF